MIDYVNAIENKDIIFERLTTIYYDNPNRYDAFKPLDSHTKKLSIDIDGYIVYDHAGEGQYEETEIMIQKALRERSDRLNMNVDVPSNLSNPENIITVDYNKVKRDSTYP